MSPLLLTASQVAQLLGARPYEVVRLIESGELPAGKVGQRWAVAPSQVQAFAERVAPSVSLVAWGQP